MPCTTEQVQAVVRQTGHPAHRHLCVHDRMHRGMCGTCTPYAVTASEAGAPNNQGAEAGRYLLSVDGIIKRKRHEASTRKPMQSPLHTRDTTIPTTWEVGSPVGSLVPKERERERNV